MLHPGSPGKSSRLWRQDNQGAIPMARTSGGQRHELLAAQHYIHARERQSQNEQEPVYSGVVYSVSPTDLTYLGSPKPPPRPTRYLSTF